MAPRYQIVKTSVPEGAIMAFRTLSRARYIEPTLAPKFAQSFETWLRQVAAVTALQYPKRSGRSAASLATSARVRGRTSLSTITGYFLVSAGIAANEYGASITPKNASKLAVPMPAALRADGSPKRIGPRSWSSLGTFIYKSKRTGGEYIAYKQRATGKLIVLYTLVDSVSLKGKRTLRSNYDRMLPKLYYVWNQILSEEIARVYSMDFLSELTKAQAKRVPQLPRMPKASNYSVGLLPRYQR